MKPWSIYILSCSDGSLYTGISNNVPERIKKHNLGLGAAYTRSRLPVSLVYTEKCLDHSSALKREAAIKKLTRAAKLLLIESSA